MPLLSRRTARAVAMELSPGEGAAWAARSSDASLPRARRKQAGWLLGWIGLLTALSIAGVDLWAWAWYERVGWWLVFTGLLAFNAWQRCTPMTYVATNQRVFRLAPFGAGFQVQALHALPVDLDLAEPEALELQRRIEDLAGRQPAAATPGPAIVRAGRLCGEADRHLQPGEAILWLSRPSLRHYLLHAPLDLWTIAGLVVGVGAMLTALLAPVPTAGWLGAATLLLACVHFGWQLRGTVYVLTNRRGFRHIPGAPVRNYSLEEMRAFQRVQDAAGRGSLAPPRGSPDAGFRGVPDVKQVEDILHSRVPRDRSGEVAPSERPGGRGGELSAPEAGGREPGVDRPAGEGR